jgi:carbonic anhydrase
MTHVHDPDVKKAILEFSPNEKDNIETVKFGGITNGIETSVKEDVALLRASPWIRPGTQIVGLTYNIDDGLLSDIEGGENGKTEL